MALHGPHHVAQKSVTTMREEERTCERCWGDVMATVGEADDMAAAMVRQCMGGSDGGGERREEECFL